ncbi:HotDog domain-containing protein [Podospora didyma]|uniref:HotDog domain-containing protein n=1 Tax=Podospora didyma TaxID=330526 RepID=A0AAE0P057_9PEZI|nr:HotDog domain-containing protein [Podospora didyma]
MATTNRAVVGPAVKPHSAPKDHNQFIKDPVAHFRAIPWCAALLNDPAVLDVIVVDRRPLPSGESNFVRRVMNGPTTVRACVTFFRMLEPTSGQKNKGALTGGVPGQEKGRAISASKELLQGGGPADGEDPKNPFLLFNALLDLGEDLCSYSNTLHGGLFAVLMDEVMGTAANFQSPYGDQDHGAYTVRFNTHFRKTVQTPQIVLVRGRVVKRDGRKLHVRGTIEDKDGNVLGEADGLWIMMAQNVGRSQL